MISIAVRHISLALLAGLLLAACNGDTTTTPPPGPPLVELPPGFPVRLPVPDDNALTAERIELGKKLFFDKQLSRTGEIACGSCHLQEHAFADPRRFSIGVHGRVGTRNAPALVNMAFTTSFFWDGGVPTLEQQAIAPIINPLEMDMTMTEVVDRLKQDPAYVDLFRRAYGSEPKPEWVTKGIASFVRTLISGHSRFDRFLQGDASALNESEKRGRELFFGEKGDCFHCHGAYNLTFNTFRNNGTRVGDPDRGRAVITGLDRDEGKFRVPTLRNVALTAPYMHDGSMQTLEEVVEHYAKGGEGHPNTDPVVRKLPLTEQDKADIVALLKTFTDEGFISNPKFKP